MGAWIYDHLSRPVYIFSGTPQWVFLYAFIGIACVAVFVVYFFTWKLAKPCCIALVAGVAFYCVMLPVRLVEENFSANEEKPVNGIPRYTVYFDTPRHFKSPKHVVFLLKNGEEFAKKVNAIVDLHLNSFHIKNGAITIASDDIDPGIDVFTVVYESGIFIPDFLFAISLLFGLALSIYVPKKFFADRFMSLVFMLAFIAVTLLFFQWLVDERIIPTRPERRRGTASLPQFPSPPRIIPILEKEAQETDANYFSRITRTLHNHVERMYAASNQTSFLENWTGSLRTSTNRSRYSLSGYSYNKSSRGLFLRGYGLCSDFSFASIDLALKSGYAAQAVGLNGHVIVRTYTIDGDEYIVDSYFSSVVPHGMKALHVDPSIIKQYGNEAFIDMVYPLLQKGYMGKYFITSYLDDFAWLNWVIPLFALSLAAGLLYARAVLAFGKRRSQS